MKNNSKEVALKFNLPEFSKDDINIRLSKNLISVKAERKKETKVQRKNFFIGKKSTKLLTIAQQFLQ